MNSSEKRAAIVTGSARGIGRAIALRLAQSSINTVITSRTPEEIEATLDLVAKHSAGGAVGFGVTADVSDSDGCKTIVAQTIEQFGRIDILVNNAGIGGETKPLEHCTLSNWNEVISTNLTSAFLLATLSIPHMKRQTSGRIVNITSGAGIHPLPNMGLYGIAKAGLNMLTAYLSCEIGKSGITVNSIHPGLVLTDTILEHTHTMAKQAGIPREHIISGFTASEHLNHIGRVTEAEEVAEMVSFLCSSKAATVTGETICLGGGWFV